MTAAQKRDQVVALMKSLRKRNTYSQASSKRGKVFDTPGYGDCSSTVNLVYKRAIGVTLGARTTDQLANARKRGQVVDVPVNRNGVPDRSKMLPGDLLYFAGNDEGRRAYDYVGHVELYIGGRYLMGHGSGKGPTRKRIGVYCKARQRSKSPTRRGNRGLIAVVRPIQG